MQWCQRAAAPDVMKRSLWWVGPILGVLCTGSLAADAPSAGPIVSVTGGAVQGALSAPNYAVFKGIPFAAPPVGPLRWREPQPVKPWTGLRQAVNYQSPCAQIITNWSRAFATAASEDCLYLNVFTAEWPVKTKKPVMVWYHGGGNTGGTAAGNTSNEPPFDGESLTRYGVVLVTVDYRVGPFGFIGHPELTAESPHHASGNYGILDQVAALRWVHDNIARFGGDPGNVTVFGQSAGGRASTILISSPLTRGLIHRAIGESGFPEQGDRTLQPRQQVEQTGLLLGRVLNAPTLKELRAVPTAAILAAMPEVNRQLNGLLIDASSDGYAVPERSTQIYRSHHEAPVPLMVGANGHDGGGSMYIRAAGEAQLTGSPERIRGIVKQVIGEVYGKYPDLQERALKAYGFEGGTDTAPVPPSYGGLDVQFGTDVFQRCPSLAVASWHSAVAPTYHYEFTRGDEAHVPIHTAELKYVFGHLADWDSGAQAHEFATMIQKYWTNFAKTGDPNGPGLPLWPKYDAKSHQSMELGNQGAMAIHDLRSEQCGIYAERLQRDLNAYQAAAR
jgi:para-nitrobenzyl esterase